ncbi:MAG TPA: hypothetical protein VNO32_58035 [Candidatus Acidoferrum sp.]|jgi:hypothetical protein|nr:hypothetical protein [Candidatus Acidoferrum sp.]
MRHIKAASLDRFGMGILRLGLVTVLNRLAFLSLAVLDQPNNTNLPGYLRFQVVR